MNVMNLFVPNGFDIHINTCKMACTWRREFIGLLRGTVFDSWYDVSENGSSNNYKHDYREDKKAWSLTPATCQLSYLCKYMVTHSIIVYVTKQSISCTLPMNGQIISYYITMYIDTCIKLHMRQNPWLQWIWSWKLWYEGQNHEIWPPLN